MPTLNDDVVQLLAKLDATIKMSTEFVADSKISWYRHSLELKTLHELIDLRRDLIAFDEKAMLTRAGLHDKIKRLVDGHRQSLEEEKNETTGRPHVLEQLDQHILVAK